MSPSPESPAPAHSGPRLLDAGETALVAEFGDVVDPVLNDRVLALDAAVTARALPGVRESVPTYRSLMIHYDPLVIDRATLAAEVTALAQAAPAEARHGALWTIPCCYDPEFGEDIATIAASTGLAPDEVVRLHSGARYRLYMYGFAPGYCYLGGLPEAFATVSRRLKPRPPHPPNVVMMAGGLASIATVSMPTGWFLVGRTPERMFSLTRTPTVLLDVGDELMFEPIDRATFDTLEARAAAGEVVARREPQP
ncbi:5-oxoprolinase subunit B family protein [Xanthobacter versatilis]|uniref:5-oxoprolinase subunit B family protein n=1 Tax=Xanthobacter autotrophicus (strain ATCC BAA-1158 / Py2) TaxID=78245 RepID=UPI003726FB90